MTASTSLAERDLFRAYWDEGLLDLLSGLALLLMGFGWATELGPLAVVQAPLWIVLWGPLRRRVVEPRSGYVRFSLSRRRRNTRRLWSTLAAGVGILGLTTLIFWLLRERSAGPLAEGLVAGLPAVLVAIAAAFASVFTGARRFLFYGLALVAAALATVLLALGPGLPLLVVGGIAALAGGLLLARFLLASREYQDA